MKKRGKRITCIVSATVATIVFTLCFLFIYNNSGCGGKKWDFKVSSYCFFGDNSLKVDIFVRNIAYRQYAEQSFETYFSLEQFGERITEMTNKKAVYTAEMFDDILFITMQTEKLSCFAASAAETDNDKRTRIKLSNMGAHLNAERNKLFFFPYHLAGSGTDGTGITDYGKHSLDYYFFDNETIDIAADFAAWKEFYAAFGHDRYLSDDEAKTITGDGVKLTFHESSVTVSK